MRIEYSPRGIFLSEIGLWLDAQEPQEACWISHAHSDHARSPHGTVFATPATLSLYRTRLGLDEAGFRPLDYHECAEFHGARLTACPASHILGAAQLLVEHRGERLVYTGDIKLRPPLCGCATETVACDHLIIESTFGLPIFHFLETEQARRRIAGFARECLDEQTTPVFLGSTLGRGQEMVHVLSEAGIPVSVHGAIVHYLPLYEAAGYPVQWEPYDAESTKGTAVVVTPGLRDQLEASARNLRFAYVSGWAALANARLGARAEHLIPYSDHGDFQELISMVQSSGARRVDVVHGYAEAFARILRQTGCDARAAGVRAPEDE